MSTPRPRPVPPPRPGLDPPRDHDGSGVPDRRRPRDGRRLLPAGPGSARARTLRRPRRAWARCPGAPLVELVGDADAPARPQRSTGLFHLAILVPDRAELARSLRRVLAAGAGFTGASDHLVSEALYLRIPRATASRSTATAPGRSGAARTGRSRWTPCHSTWRGSSAPSPRGRRRRRRAGGHADGPRAPPGARPPRRRGLLRGGAGFRAHRPQLPRGPLRVGGGYHHHLGLNTWGTAGAPPPPPGAGARAAYRVVVPSVAEVSRVAGRLEARGIEASASDEGLRVTDPAGNRVIVQTREHGAA